MSGDIEIPDRQLKITLSISGNPASHIVELTVVQSQDSSDGGIAMVPGVMMKTDEKARGTPLAGVAVKVSDGSFQVRLSNVDAERERNVQLLTQRSWLDIPLRYTNQRRAILAIEKGPTATQLFKDAFSGGK